MTWTRTLQQSGINVTPEKQLRPLSQFMSTDHLMLHLHHEYDMRLPGLNSADIMEQVNRAQATHKRHQFWVPMETQPISSVSHPVSFSIPIDPPQMLQPTSSTFRQVADQPLQEPKQRKVKPKRSKPEPTGLAYHVETSEVTAEAIAEASTDVDDQHIETAKKTPKRLKKPQKVCWFLHIFIQY